MFTDSGICWVIWCVSAFAFRWFSLQGDKFDSFDYPLTLTFSTVKKEKSPMKLREYRKINRPK